ncbi:hypothetical protein DAPPUDRAFT_240105 [Daphnia pulex]|uniref:Uncharacterized protein n=1 Tax=Daphnia pulex TaxID=6669 RepID=E9GAW2_DAPPU|nr:hypothetical protein DAPPUDRAFT_240105 [Daphnia pulex]|eukprot:EFX83474.1 hypothetical protein DAPPUDRAFT_240105 [Daphnia pulex]
MGSSANGSRATMLTLEVVRASSEDLILSFYVPVARTDTDGHRMSMVSDTNRRLATPATSAMISSSPDGVVQQKPKGSMYSTHQRSRRHHAILEMA